MTRKNGRATRLSEVLGYNETEALASVEPAAIRPRQLRDGDRMERYEINVGPGTRRQDCAACRNLVVAAREDGRQPLCAVCERPLTTAAPTTAARAARARGSGPGRR